MAQILAALAAGLLFGAGLTISQMVDPMKVLNFLDVAGIATGRWDPSLGLVMAAALAVTLPAFRLLRHRERPVLAPRFVLPASRAPDRPLLAGAVLFGIGWGLVGFCPGPAIAALAFGLPETLMFVAAMLAGMLLHRQMALRRDRRLARRGRAAKP